jgi:hypothetical protein
MQKRIYREVNGIYLLLLKIFGKPFERLGRKAMDLRARAYDRLAACSFEQMQG